VDLIGIEPMTSSMPWNCEKRKLLTVKWLEVGVTGKAGSIGVLWHQFDTKSVGRELGRGGPAHKHFPILNSIFFHRRQRPSRRNSCVLIALAVCSGSMRKTRSKPTPALSGLPDNSA